jgi:hypothetical protein
MILVFIRSILMLLNPKRLFSAAVMIQRRRFLAEVKNGIDRWVGYIDRRPIGVGEPRFKEPHHRFFPFIDRKGYFIGINKRVVEPNTDGERLQERVRFYQLFWQRKGSGGRYRLNHTIQRLKASWKEEDLPTD